MDDKKKHSCHARHLQAGDCAVERVLATATANRRRRRAAAVQPLGVTTRTMEPRVHVTGTSPPPGPAEPGMAADRLAPDSSGKATKTLPPGLLAGLAISRVDGPIDLLVLDVPGRELARGG